MAREFEVSPRTVVGLLGVLVLAISFLPWFHVVAAEHSGQVGAVVPADQWAWDSAVGSSFVVLAAFAGLLASRPGHGVLTAGAAVAAAALGLIRVAISPATQVLGESLALQRTGWLVLAVAAVAVQAALATVAMRRSAPAVR